ncbi:MAG: ribose-5-phosphate isomerase RpiA [Chloroflexota bacterium]
MSPNTSLKQQAAEFAVTNFIQSDMLVGLGVGSTAIFAVQKLAQLIASKALSGITAIPCSLAVEQEAIRLGIPLVDFTNRTEIDVTIDGADEVDPDLNLIKGGGGALLREKIVAQASKREVIVVDEGKLSEQLGIKWAVPIEVSVFGWQSQAGFLESIGGQPALRETDQQMPYQTDQGNYILDTDFGPIDDPTRLAAKLKQRTGILEHGLFINMATDLVIAGADGITHRSI